VVFGVVEHVSSRRRDTGSMTSRLKGIRNCAATRDLKRLKTVIYVNVPDGDAFAVFAFSRIHHQLDLAFWKHADSLSVVVTRSAAGCASARSARQSIGLVNHLFPA
jgi:hypothetical protein